MRRFICTFLGLVLYYYLLLLPLSLRWWRFEWKWMSEWVRDQIKGAHLTNLCRRRPVSTTVGIIIILHLGIMSSTRWCVSRVVLALARDNYKDVVVVFSYSSAVDLSENGFLSCCCWDDTTLFCSLLCTAPSCLTVVIVLWRAIHPIPHPPIRAGIIIFMLHLPLCDSYAEAVIKSGLVYAQVN